MNKPVAIVRKYTISGIDNFHVEMRTKLKEGTALYTHPVKELTQGEIHAVWARGSYYTLDKKGNVEEIRFEDFARAILGKASEK